MNQNKKEILSNALLARQKEVFEYQINIDNFRLAIDLAAKDPELTDFHKHLSELLASNLLEQKKANIMLQVIQQQMEN
jgi:hypothetical protein